MDSNAYLYGPFGIGSLLSNQSAAYQRLENERRMMMGARPQFSNPPLETKPQEPVSKNKLLLLED